MINPAMDNGIRDAAPADGEQRKIELVMALRKQGIRDCRVLSAIERIPRDHFVEPAFQHQAYEDHALPIECNQTISQPFVVAYMSEALQLSERMKVLELGTGSGYQAAVLSLLCRRVTTIERHKTLYDLAQKRFELLRLYNITPLLGDGLKGWPAQAPFDRIMVTAAAENIPQALVEQLKPGGIMVLPVNSGGGQILVRVRKDDEGATETDELLDVRFVPLIEGLA